MSELYIAGLAIVLALAFIAWQQVVVRKLEHTLLGIGLGKLRVRVDEETQTILIKPTGE